MNTVQLRGCLSVGCLAYQCHQVTCEEFSQCYDDICLWTDGSWLTQSEAQAACQQRNDSSLVRISDANIAANLPKFLSDSRTYSLHADNISCWIDVTQVRGIGFHWIDDSQLACVYLSLSLTYTRTQHSAMMVAASSQHVYRRPRIAIAISAECHILVVLFSSFFRPPIFRRPWADFRETLPHDAVCPETVDLL